MVRMYLSIFFTCIVWKAIEKGLMGQVSVYRQYPFKASANKNEKHNKKYKVRVSQYIDMLTQDVVKIRKKGKKPLKESEKVAEIKDIKASIGLF